MEAILAKVRRAEALIGELSRANEHVMSSAQKPYRIERRHDASAKRFQFWGYSQALPHDLSALVGDAVHNLRSSLDHMIWKLAEKNRHPDPKAQFVARAKASEFRKDRRGALACIGPEALQLLDTVQPYHAPTPRDAPLYVLTDLDNRDKHRALLAIGAAARMGDQLVAVEMPGVPVPNPAGFAIGGLSPPKTVEMTPNGALVFEVEFARPARHIGFEMEFNVNLALANAGSFSKVPVVDALLQLRDVAQRTLKVFEPLV